MLTILDHLVQVILILIDTFNSTKIFLGNCYGFITHRFIMHQHPNLADGIVVMSDDAEVTNGEGIVESLADLDD